MKSTLFISVLILTLLLQFSSAVLLDNGVGGVVINTSASNSSLTFVYDNINFTRLEVNSDSVNLTDVTCIGSGLNSNQVFWNTLNSNNDSASYCTPAPSPPPASNSCSSILDAFSQYPLLIGLIGSVFLFGLIIVIMFGFAMIKPEQDISTEGTAMFIIGLAVVFITVLVGIIAITSICSTGVI